MFKRSLVILLTSLLLTLPTAAMAELTTLSYPRSALTFSIANDTLSISGAIECEDLAAVWVHVGEDEKIMDVQSGTALQISFPLSGSADLPITIYTRKSGEELFWSYIWQTITLRKTDSGWQIEDTTAYDHNCTLLAESWYNPADMLLGDIDPTVAAKAVEVVGTETDLYQRLYLLHKWVAENIYYDYDSFTGKTASTPLTSAEVLSAGYSVCQGYATLLVDMARSLGIPCMCISTYSAGVGSDGFLSSADTEAILQGQTSSNHAHAVAWVNGRLIHMDPTWDSPNRYENGKKEKGVNSGILYFDTTLAFLSRNHLLLHFPTTNAENTPSTWAIPELHNALSHDLIPLTEQHSYTKNITRADFCTLLVTMLQQKTDCATLDALCSKFAVTTTDTAFTDLEDNTAKEAIFVANALSIVNGRGDGIFDPNAGITRQEAATMLMRAAKVLGIEMGASPKSFSDMDKAADWAAIGILYTSSLVDANGKVVMGGTSTEQATFSPLDGYTREQAMLTMERMYSISTDS